MNQIFFYLIVIRIVIMLKF